MIKKFTLALAVLMAGIMVYDANNNMAHTNNAGAPAGRTGNPGELSGASCNITGCHVGGPAVSDETVTVTSTVPSNGYTPGETYTVTIQMDNPGGTKFGFEISPQSNTGTLLGTLSNPGGGSQLIGSSKYVTHTLAGNSGNGTKSWTFDWTAPAMGTGAVTFWGAYNFANGNNSTSGDVIVNDTYVVQEAPVSVNEINSLTQGFSVYPNPASGSVNIAFSLTEPENVSIELYSVDGKQVSKLNQDYLLTGDHRFTFDLNTVSSGIYFVKLSDGRNDHYRKVLVK